MPKVEIFTSLMCPYCSSAKSLLKNKGVDFDEIDVTFSPRKRRDMAQRAGRTSVPQIWIGGEHVGGCDELQALDASGKLDPMLNSA